MKKSSLYKALLLANLSLPVFSAYSMDGDYMIPTTNITNQVAIERNFYDQFNIDDVTVGIKGMGQIDIINKTPRILYQPIIQVNDTLYLLDAEVPAFTTTTVNISLPETLENISVLNEVPFFKTNVKEYAQTQYKTIWGTVDEDMASDYNTTIKGWKYIDNRFDTNQYFLTWKDSYGANWTDATRIKNFISRLNYQHSAIYYRLQGASAVGMASGSGRIAMYASQLKPGVKSTYYHEKMHNHGFSHSSGMTYGWADVIRQSINSKGIDFFGNAETLDQGHLFAKVISLKTEGNNQVLRIAWGSKDPQFTEIKGVITATDNVKLNINLGVINDGQLTNALLPSVHLPAPPEESTFAGSAFIYEQPNNSIPVNTIDEINTQENGMEISFPRPKLPTTIYVNVATDLTGEHSGSLIYPYPSSAGFSNPDYNATLFLEKTTAGDYKMFTPQEAESYCDSKGLSLGVLPPANSDEMIALQNLYQMRGSMVGLSAENSVPTAFNVPSNYRPQYIEEAEAGALVVCSL